MFVRQSTHDAVVKDRDLLSALVQKQAADLRDRATRHAATEREACDQATHVDQLNKTIEKLTDILADERRRTGIKITELNETIEDRDQQLRHAYRQINKRGERGRFVKRSEA